MGTDLGGKEGGVGMNERPDIAPILAQLKDFQRNSVDHAFRQLYETPDTTGRFLVADEVGLGKTLIAKGLIAKAIDHLWDTEERIDVLYICSNADIARQNINRLRLNRSAENKFVFATRSTLLPVKVQQLQQNKVNYISLTPSTSFEMKSNLGMWEERILLYCLLRDAWNLESEGTGPLNVLQGAIQNKQWFRDGATSYADEHAIDEDLKAAFLKELEGTNLRESFLALCEEFRYSKKRGSHMKETLVRQNQVVGELRERLAFSSLGALNPDLIVMDEFQRFKQLFDDQTEAGSLAKGLFQRTEMKHGTKILLLSATPYKMYTTHQESGSEDHYRDFLDTIRFLFKGRDESVRVQTLLESFGKEVYRLQEPDGLSALQTIKSELEEHLRKIMVRTERLAATEDRNGMLTQVHTAVPTLSSSDVADYLTLQSVAATVEDTDVLEYWKTSPYLLNMMDDYQFKKRFEQAVRDVVKNPLLTDLIRSNEQMFLSSVDIQHYEELDPRNLRLREFAKQMKDMWKLLWLPPSLPYYQLAGSYAYSGNPTKRLVFSSWRVVPKVLAAFLSYEAERQMTRGHEVVENTAEARKSRGKLLQFARSQNRLTGMPILTMLYPSQWMARQLDPLNLGGAQTDLQDIRESVMRAIQENLQGLIDRQEEKYGAEDEAWYWAAPVLLDFIDEPESVKAWWDQPNLPSIWRRAEEDADDTHWADHIDEVRSLLRGERGLKRMPGDLAEVLCDMALGGPAVCALRGLLRYSESADFPMETRNAAAQIGWSFRTLYNLPEVTSLLRSEISLDPYWRKPLIYGAQGCLQAVLDEYFHLLVEGFGGFSREAVDDLSSHLGQVLTLRNTSFYGDDIRLEDEKLSLKRNAIHLRARFARRFGDEQGENGEKTPKTQVRNAFNSPFWPFVLTTTSVGQEGLDFHTYCHAVVHWDLPSNPVDLEQREGRVHRYKGHAVRKNVANAHESRFWERLSSDSREKTPWEILFQEALDNRGQDENDLVPFWLYPLQNGAKIERHVIAHVLSRDFHKLSALRRSLAVYRMVFGQPRQEDLVQFLLTHLDDQAVQHAVDELRINLSPLNDADYEHASCV
jgi:hypothetical protein